MIAAGKDWMRNWMAALVAAGVFFAALPIEAFAQSRQVSPIYGGASSAGGKSYAKPKLAKAKKPAKPRTVKQQAAQKKATKAAAAKMKRSGPTTKQKAAQRKATKAAAVKAKAKPNRRRA